MTDEKTPQCEKINADQAKVIVQYIVSHPQLMACVYMLYGSANPWIDVPAIAQMHGFGMGGVPQQIPTLKADRVADFLHKLADAVEEAGDVEVNVRM